MCYSAARLGLSQEKPVHVTIMQGEIYTPALTGKKKRSGDYCSHPRGVSVLYSMM